MPCDASCEDSDICDEEPGDSAFEGSLPVFCEAARAAEPGEGSLDDPASGQDFEALGLVGSADDFDGPLSHLEEGRSQFLTGVSAIGKDVTQPWKAVTRLGEHRRCAIPVLDVSPVNDGGNQEAPVSVRKWRLRSLIFLPASYPDIPPLSVVFTLWLSITPAVG